jgi:aminoacylase
MQVTEFVANKPVVIGHLAGSEPSLPSIVLNSHYDVVPVMAEHWSCAPFSAEVRQGYQGALVPPEHAQGSEPCVYGRGTQDMKCVCVQYLAALQRLRATGWQPRRNIHLTFMVRMQAERLYP